MLPGLKRAPRTHSFCGNCCAWKILLLALLFLFLSIVAEDIDIVKVDDNQGQSPSLAKLEQESKVNGPTRLKKVPLDGDDGGIWKNFEDELGASAGSQDHTLKTVFALNKEVRSQPSSKESLQDVRENVNVLSASGTSKAGATASLGTVTTSPSTPSKAESEGHGKGDGSGEASLAASKSAFLGCRAAGADADGSIMREVCAANQEAVKLQQRIPNTFVPVPKGSTLVDLLLYGLPPPCEELSPRHVAKTVIEELKEDGQILPEQKVAEADHRSARLKPLGLDEYKRTMEKHVLQKERNESAPVIPPPPPHRAPTDRARYNYAAAANGAKVVAANKEAKGPSAVLDEDKDKYLRNPCSAEEKWIVVELSEEILADTVVISNYEFYSSNPKDFEVLGSQRFPTDTWVSLGTFHAVNVRTPQFFSIVQPRVWIRYMMLRMLSQHGSEVYCTLSLVRVHGVDALQEFKEEMELMSQEVEKVVNVLRESSPPGAAIVAPPVPESLPNIASSTNTAKTAADSKATSSSPDGGISGGAVPLPASNSVDSKKGEAGMQSTPDSGGSSRPATAESAPADVSGGGGRPSGTSGSESTSNGAPSEKAAGGDGVSSQDVGDASVGTGTIPTSKGGSAASEGGSGGSGTVGSGASAKGGTPGSTSTTPSGGVGVQGGGSGGSRPPTGDFIFKTLMQKIKSLELNQSIFDRYVEDLNHKYLEMFSEIEGDIANLEGGLRNATSMVQTLRTRLAERDARATAELDALRAEMSTHLSAITSELTTLRLHSARMEKREAAAVGTSLLCVFVSAILYFIGVLRSRSFTTLDTTADVDTPTKGKRRGMAASNFCYGAAVMILFVGTSFITLILSV